MSVIKNIATLGPANTFSEIATKKYLAETKQDFKIVFYPTITKVVKAVGNTCDLGLVPIENMVDGFVQITLDLLLNSDLYIIHEILLPIQFSFLGTGRDLKDIEKIYAQFVTQGQCQKFLERFDTAQLVTTQSNGESLQEIKRMQPKEGAIVPQYVLKSNLVFPLTIEDVNDYRNNRTRFVGLSESKLPQVKDLDYKTSIVIISATDKPGILSKLLNAFSDRNINLLSILSRPTKEVLGKYHFFVDIEGYFEDELIKSALQDIEERAIVKVLGSYPIANN